MRHPPAMPVLEPSHWTRGATAFRRERALARREGLWISAGALRTARRVREEDNAAAVLMGAVGDSLRRPPNARVGIAMGRLPDAVWHAASHRPRLVFERDWEHPHEALRPELASFKSVGRRLCELAREGHEPRENLLAVARLAALVAQEPCSTCQFISLALGKMALRAAMERGLGREVEAALGEPSFRQALRAAALGLPPPVRPKRRYWPRTVLWMPVSPWTRRLAPEAADRRQSQALRAFRRLYRLLGTLDEKEAFRRVLPTARGLLGQASPFPFGSGLEPSFLGAFARYRELRGAAREEKPCSEPPRNPWRNLARWLFGGGLTSSVPCILFP